MMDEGGFWATIQRAAAAGPSTAARVSALEAELRAAPPADLEAFDAHVWGWFLELDRKELWAAAYVIMGGASDDAFDYFKQWLMLQGHAVVLAAVRDPDTIADLPLHEHTSTEFLLSLAKRTFEEREGRDMPNRHRIYPDVTAWPPDRVPDYDWTEETTAQLFPRLTARCPWKAWL
jgi:hypothetical protein